MRLLRIKNFILPITLICAGLLICATLCACNKTPITRDQLTTLAKENNLTCKDVTKDWASNSYVSAAYAMGDYSWTINFLFVDNSEAAHKIFEDQVKEYDSAKERNDSTVSTMSMGNTESFELTNQNKYVFIERVGTTVLFSDNRGSEKAKVTKFIEKVGY